MRCGDDPDGVNMHLLMPRSGRMRGAAHRFCASVTPSSCASPHAGTAHDDSANCGPPPRARLGALVMQLLEDALAVA